LVTLPLDVTALQLTHGAWLTIALTPLTLVPSQALLLLLLMPMVKLQAYAPTYTALTDPPYEFALRKFPVLIVEALQLEQGTSLTFSMSPFTVVPSQALLLMLLASLLQLQAYAPM
jgi:hypothetical protein